MTMNFVTIQKARDFREVVFDILRTHKNIGFKDALMLAAKSPAPRFYVTFENARRFVSMLHRGIPLPVMHKNKLHMFEELHCRYEERCKDQEKASYTILEQLINEQAPSFYTAPDTLASLFYKAIRAKK